MQFPSAHGPGIALRDYGLAELTMAIDALAMRGSRVHVGIHQARKAIRRTRAMLALGESVLGPGTNLIDRQLRRVNRRLSPLRDTHALVQTLDRLGIKARDEPTGMVLDRARRIATRRRRRPIAKAGVRAGVAAGAGRTGDAARSAAGLALGVPPASVVTEAMTSAAQKAEAARQRAYAHDDADDWHRWRRCMRRISQQHRAVIAEGLAAPVSGFVKSLTEQLGVMQDLSLLAAHCDKDSPFPKSSLALRRFAERTLARQRKRIRSVVTHL